MYRLPVERTVNRESVTSSVLPFFFQWYSAAGALNGALQASTTVLLTVAVVLEGFTWNCPA